MIRNFRKSYLELMQVDHPFLRLTSELFNVLKPVMMIRQENCRSPLSGIKDEPSGQEIDELVDFFIGETSEEDNRAFEYFLATRRREPSRNNKVR